MATKYWFSQPPANCENCDSPIKDIFYDAALKPLGIWGCVCTKCFTTRGSGLGVGKGQEYTRQGNKWVQTAGGSSASTKEM